MRQVRKKKIKTPDYVKRVGSEDTEADVYKSGVFMPAEVNKSDTFIFLFFIF